MSICYIFLYFCNKSNIQLLVSQGLGIQLKFLTQALHKESIKGFIKNNFEEQATFSIGYYLLVKY